MSNTEIGRGKKGSKFWMQAVVETPTLQKELNGRIGEDLQWISPLAGEAELFLEYELNHSYVRSFLGISKEEGEELFGFWAKRQPQWDGLAFSQDGTTLYLVEAKAHLSELESKCLAKNVESKILIEKSMKEVHDEYFPNGDFSAWLDKYYQLANRLTFLRKLNEKAFGKIKKVKLVLLNFVKDNSYIPTTNGEWEKHYGEVFHLMTGSVNAPADVIIVNFDVNGRGIMPNPMGGSPLVK